MITKMLQKSFNIEKYSVSLIAEDNIINIREYG